MDHYKTNAIGTKQRTQLEHDSTLHGIGLPTDRLSANTLCKISLDEHKQTKKKLMKICAQIEEEKKTNEH